jgi:hypothetical protein
MDIHHFDYTDLADENGNLRQLTAEERAEILALSSEERAAFMKKYRAEMQKIYAARKASPRPPYGQVQLLYGPPNALNRQQPAGFKDFMRKAKAAAKDAAQEAVSDLQDWVEDDTWYCQCGAENAGEVCSICGSARPESNGAKAAGTQEKNIAQRMAPPKGPRPVMVYGPPSALNRPQPAGFRDFMRKAKAAAKDAAQEAVSDLQNWVGDDVWKCRCGTENTGEFCTNCGNPKE